jgi:hypothetical protein
MIRDLTDDDKGKPVFTFEGNMVGRITDAENGNGIGETDDESNLTDKIKSALNWDDDDDTHKFQSDDIDSISDEGVRLRDINLTRHPDS